MSLNATHNFAGLIPAKSPLLWEQVLLSQGLQSSLDCALCRAHLTALNLKFNSESLELWFKTYSWPGGQLNLRPEAREDERVLGEWFEAFTLPVKSNGGGLISLSWPPRDRDEGQKEMSQRWGPGEGFAQDGSGGQSVCMLVAHSHKHWGPCEQTWWHVGGLQPKAGLSSPRLAHALSYVQRCA